MTKKLLSTMAALVALSAQANVMLSDFDTGGPYYGGTQGWFPYGAAGMGTISNPTGGSSTWMTVSPFQYYGSFTMQSWANPQLTAANLNANQKLEFDLILPGSGANAWLPNNASQNINIALQVGGGALPEQNNNVNVTFNGSLKDQVIHIAYDYSGWLPADSTATYVNLSLNLYPGYDWGWDGGNPGVIPYAAQVFVDNVQLTGAVVPEPSSLALAALAGLGLVFRKRRS